MTTSTTRTTSIAADPDVPLIRIVREFDAPPEKVFRAHVDPELVVQWLGPRSVTMQVEHYDARTGGSYRYVHTSGGQQYAFHGSFHEVRPGRIVQTFTWEGDPDGVALETLTFEDMGDGRTRLHAQSLCDSFESRDGWLRSGMDGGMNQGYAKLDALLADGAV